MNKRQSRYRIIKNKNIFEDLISLVFQERDEKVQLKLVEQASLWAYRNCTGMYSDNKTEKYLCSVAKKYHVEQHDYKAGTFLHVATEVQATGGHTRLIDNWITNSDNGEKHSLALTCQLDEQVPVWLEESIVEKTGNIYNINEVDYIKNALRLRELASTYEYVILYTHMYDIRPLIAFGTEEFKRPIIFYNHADHVFWLGMSIVDMLVELSHDGKYFSLKNRGKRATSVLAIPIKHNNQRLNKEKAIQKIDKDLAGKNIIVSMAAPYKYNPIDNYDFICIAKEIIENNSNSYFVVIGPDRSLQPEWENAFQETNGKIDAVGYKQRDEVLLYIAIADLYIDSLPFYSYTSMLEFAISGIPILSLNTPVCKIDVMYKGEVLCDNSDDLVSKANEVLQSPKSIAKYIIQKEVHKLSDHDAWTTKKDYIVKSTPKLHKLHFDFSNKNEINSYDIFMEMMNRTEIPYILFTRELHGWLRIKVIQIFILNKAISYKLLIHLMKHALKWVNLKFKAQK
jgi:hypothetical protein